MAIFKVCEILHGAYFRSASPVWFVDPVARTLCAAISLGDGEELIFRWRLK